jgi:hypothetical protein
MKTQVGNRRILKDTKGYTYEGYNYRRGQWVTLLRRKTLEALIEDAKILMGVDLIGLEPLGSWDS